MRGFAVNLRCRPFTRLCEMHFGSWAIPHDFQSIWCEKHEYIVCLGGNISQQDQQEHNGQGGSSYISYDGIDHVCRSGEYTANVANSFNVFIQ